MVTLGDMEHFSSMYDDEPPELPVQLHNPLFWNYLFCHIVGTACQAALSCAEELRA
mgnify:CR=1 FL=1